MSPTLFADDYRLPDRSPAHWHPWVRERWPALEERLRADGFGMWVNEGYRPELRQQWLYAQGRSVPECEAKGIRPGFARPGPRITNAWSAAVSAHGWTMTVEREVVPAAAALDVVPIGLDGKPWTHDDPWDAWLHRLAAYGPGVGLVHFVSPTKGIWDKPHLQLVEWDDRTHQLHG